MSVMDDDISDMFAAISLLGDLAELRELLNRGVDVNMRCFNNQTALMMAADEGLIDIVIELLNRGAQVNTQDDRGHTALICASLRGFVSIAQKLLNHGAYIDVQEESGYTALHYAALHGHLELVRVLVNRGANVNMKHRTGDTALISAVKNSEIVRELLNHGANINAQNLNGFSALMKAANGEFGQGFEDTVRELLSRGANIKLKNHAGYTALMCAGSEKIELLIKTVAASDTNPFAMPQNILNEMLILATKEGRGNTVRELLSRGANVNAEDGYGKTALKYATEKRFLEIIQMLKNAGAK